jgi:hypothetical protein
MPDIIDVSFTCGGSAGFLAGAGVQTIIRYYSRDTGILEKRLTRKEALQFAAAGVRLAIVHEAKHGDKIGSFSQALGELDGAYAREYGTNTIGQPANSTIYFGVDFDASASEAQNSIIPYFKGVATAFAAANTNSMYRVGVYGSGRTCAALLQAQLAEFAWLAQSKGWADYKVFRDSKKWSLLQAMPAKVGEIECDPDTRNGEFGDFFLSAPPDPMPAAGTEMTVTARPGLRLRAGPGTDFDVIQIVPFGTKVFKLKTVGDWTMVDLGGDGASDGFVSTHFLS